MRLLSKRKKRFVIPLVLIMIVISACTCDLIPWPADETPPPQQPQPTQDISSPPTQDISSPPTQDIPSPPTQDIQPPATQDVSPPLIGLDYNLDPNFGEITLEAGFSPDP